MASGGAISSLLLEEYFASADDRFLKGLRGFHDSKRLATLADRWKRDHRPWARQQIFRYLSEPLDCPGHHPVVKRLFKFAEQNGDAKLMGAFMVAFDRLVRRTRKARYRYDYETRESWQEERLRTPRNSIFAAMKIDPKTKQPIGAPAPAYAPQDGRLFTYHTRYYLRRRAWRFFRRMAYGKPSDYPAAVAAALARYTDEDFAKGENILDSWGLIHACFRRHQALDIGTAVINVAEGHSLAELAAAPAFLDLWAKAESAGALLTLLVEARSRLVRVWATQLLRCNHRDHLAGIAPQDLLALLDHPDEEVQQLGAELLQTASGLAQLPLATWFILIKTKNLTALQTICEVMQKHVSPQRLELAQCIELACEKPAPVARMGLTFLEARSIATGPDREAISAVAGARCAIVAADLTRWALSIFGTKENYDVELVSRFFDSLLRETREAAWAWLTKDTPGFADPALWSRLIESPHDDVRMHLVDALQYRASLPGTGADALAPLWCSVLLGVHRGGRQKLKALRQISEAVQGDPKRAAGLLPVLAVAIRSVRPAEARAGIAAVVRAIAAAPELSQPVAKFLPELQIPEEAPA